MQSRIDSLLETLTNILIGLVVSFVANLYVLPYYLGVTVSVATNIHIGIAYTLVSLARQYVLRRLFNGLTAWAWLKDKFHEVTG